MAADDAVRVVVLTGEGRAFSSGVDLKALGGRSLEGGSVGDLLDLPARRAIELLTTMPKVVVAKVNGFCFTGALELALACDLVVTADEAKFGDTHAKFGLRPTWGMSQRLIRLVGVARARELSYTARTFTGVEAAEWGLAVRSVPRDELDAAVDELVADDRGQQRGLDRRLQGPLPGGPRPRPGRPGWPTRRRPTTRSPTPRSGSPTSADRGGGGRYFGIWLQGRSLSTRTSPGRPSMRSPRMLRMISDVPPSMVLARDRRKRPVRVFMASLLRVIG